MGIPLIDKSYYLRGLLILARKGNYISPTQKEFILNAGNRLGFSKDFCEETLESLLYNHCLCDDPVKFESDTVAKSFIADGIKLACLGSKISQSELNWLKRSSKLNNIAKEWFDKQLKQFELVQNSSVSAQLTLYSLL